MNVTNERELVEDILNGEYAKFRIIVERYSEVLFRIAIGYMRTEADAEEVVQQVFVKAYAQLSSFKGLSKLSTWLCRIAVTSSLNELAKRDRGRSFKKRVKEENHPNEGLVGLHIQNPEEQLIKAELKEMVQKGIDSLPPQQKTALILQRYQELSQKEIAEVMEISEGAVEQHLYRAKANLKRFIEKKEYR